MTTATATRGLRPAANGKEDPKDPTDPTDQTDLSAPAAPAEDYTGDVPAGFASQEELDLYRLARAVEDHRAAMRIPMARFLARFPQMPTSKPWGKILRADFSEINVRDMTARTRGVWQVCEEEKLARERTDLYEDMHPAEAVALAVSELLREHGNSRFVFVAGPAAHGKTSSLQLVMARYPGMAVIVSAHEGWSAHEIAMRSIARALGVGKTVHGKTPRGGGEWLDAITHACRESSTLLLIDEAHHMTGKALNAVKEMINSTRLRIVAAGIPTLWEKLTARSYEEAEQLRLNRMLCRVNLVAPPVDDVQRFLERRTGRKCSRAGANKVAQAAHEYGAYKFLHRVAEVIETEGDTITETEASAAALRIARDIDGRR